MANILTENFDGVTAPALPTTLVYEAGWTTTAVVSRSAPNALTSSGLTTFYTQVQDGNAGDASVTLALRTSGGGEYGPMVRCKTRAYGSLTGYLLLYQDDSNSLVLLSRVSGSNTTIATLSTSGLFAGFSWYALTLTANGTTIAVSVQRDSDGHYLSSGGTWQSAPADVFTVTDSSISGQGYGGGLGYQTTYIDDFSFDTAGSPPATSYTLTAPSPATGRVGVSSNNFTVTPVGGVSTDTVTPYSNIIGDTFSPTTVTFSGTGAQTFTCNGVSTGARTISTTNTGSLTNPSSVTFTVYSLSLFPSSQSVGNSIAASLTATLTGGSGSLAAGTSGGTLSTTTPTSGVSFTLTTQASGSGTDTVTVTGPGGTSAVATVNYASTPATALILSGPATGPVGSTSPDFTVSVNGPPPAAVIVTPHSDGAGDIFTPGTVTLDGTHLSKTFTTTAVSSGLRRITLTNSGSLTNPASLDYTASDVLILNACCVGFSTGLTGTIGFTVYNSVGAVVQARITVGVAELGSTGSYVATFDGVVDTQYYVVWDDGSGNTAMQPISVPGPVSINLAQTGLTPRALDAVADTSLTVGDALVAALCGAAGKQTVASTSYLIQTPHTGTTIRSFTLNSATAPTSRS